MQQSIDPAKVVPSRNYKIDEKSSCCADECYLKRIEMKDKKKGKIIMYINSCLNCGKPSFTKNEWKDFEAKQVVNYAELDEDPQNVWNRSYRKKNKK